MNVLTLTWSKKLEQCKCGRESTRLFSGNCIFCVRDIYHTCGCDGVELVGFTAFNDLYKGDVISFITTRNNYELDCSVPADS